MITNNSNVAFIFYMHIPLAMRKIPKNLPPQSDFFKKTITIVSLRFR